jgi:hypothetical protein
MLEFLKEREANMVERYMKAYRPKTNCRPGKAFNFTNIYEGYGK